MSVIKGNFGGNPTDTVDLTHAKTLQCDECESVAFRQSMMLKRLSSLVSPTGQEAIVPVAVFACETCGHVNEEFKAMEIQ